MVIAVKDPSGEFDMRVKDCEASDGASGRSLALSDPEGCIMRPKLLGKFSKVFFLKLFENLSRNHT